MSSKIFGLPQTLTGNETVTLRQIQNGQVALCTVPLNTLAAYFQLASINWSALPTTLPASKGILWNNGGALSIS